MNITEDIVEPLERLALSDLDSLPLGRALALARAWCREAHLDEAAALLRPLVVGAPTGSDPAALRGLLGLDGAAPIPVALEVLAARTPSPQVASRLTRAAELAWDAALP